MSPEELLAERETQHGDWQHSSEIQMLLKAVIRAHINETIPPTLGQLAALDMICVKISRILAGDPKHVDHWDDIAGYAKLGARDC